MRFGDPIDSRVDKPLASTPQLLNLALAPCPIKCHSAASNRVGRQEGEAHPALPTGAEHDPGDVLLVQLPFLVALASVWAMRALTSFLTSASGKGASGANRIVPLDVSYDASSSAIASMTAGAMT